LCEIKNGNIQMRHVNQCRTGESNLLMCDEIWDEIDDSWSTNPNNKQNKGRYLNKDSVNNDIKNSFKKSNNKSTTKINMAIGNKK